MEIFANATLAQRPAPDDPWLNLLIDIAKSNQSDASQRVLEIACDQQIERGRNNELRDEAKAKEAFLKAIEIDSERVFANMHSQRALARMYIRSGNLDQAEGHVVSALSMSPLFPKTWDLLGEIRWRQNRFSEAAECYRLTLKLQRETNVQKVFRITELLQLQEYSATLEAIEGYVNWIGKNRSPDVFIARGLAFAESGDFEKSIKDLGRAVKPRSSSSYVSFLSEVQLIDSEWSDFTFDRVLKDFSNLDLADKSLQSALFKQHRYPAPTVHQIEFAQTIATALAEKRDTNIESWATATLADLSAEDWEQAKASVNRRIDLKGEPNPVDQTLLAACDWKLDGLSALEKNLSQVTKDDVDSLDPKERHLLMLARLKLSGMLAADPDDQAFKKSLEFILIYNPLAPLPEAYRFFDEWYRDRIFSSWLLRADDAQAKEALEVTKPLKVFARMKPWIDARLGRSKPTLAELEKRLEDPNRSYIDMLFLAKTYSDAGRSEDAERAVFECRSLLDLEWHPDQPNKHLQPEIKWAYAMAQKQLEALESVLPKFKPQRPELEYLATANAWLKARPDVRTAKPENVTSNFDVFEQAFLKEDWASAKTISLREFDPLKKGVRSWLKAAAVISLSQDRDAYVKFCEELLSDQARTSDPGIAETVCKACLLMPDAIDLNAIPDNALTTALNEGSKGVTRNPWNWGTQALIQYRKGAFSDSLATIEKAQNLKPAEKLLGLLLAVKCMGAASIWGKGPIRCYGDRDEQSLHSMARPRRFVASRFLSSRSAEARSNCDGCERTNRPQVRLLAFLVSKTRNPAIARWHFTFSTPCLGSGIRQNSYSMKSRNSGEFHYDCRVTQKWPWSIQTPCRTNRFRFSRPINRWLVSRKRLRHQCLPVANLNLIQLILVHFEEHFVLDRPRDSRRLGVDLEVQPPLFKVQFGTDPADRGGLLFLVFSC